MGNNRTGFYTRKAKEGYYSFYWNGHDVTPLWMDFFSGLGMEDESRCTELFIKKYGSKLDKQYPVTGLVPPDSEANTDSSNSPTEATQERKES